MSLSVLEATSTCTVVIGGVLAWLLSKKLTLQKMEPSNEPTECIMFSMTWSNDLLMAY